MSTQVPDLTFAPVTAERWNDLADLFGPNGAYSNCWCTWWIFTGREFDQATPTERRLVLHTLVAEGARPGILAYDAGRPVGCARGRGDRPGRRRMPAAGACGR